LEHREFLIAELRKALSGCKEENEELLEDAQSILDENEELLNELLQMSQSKQELQIKVSSLEEKLEEALFKLEAAEALAVGKSKPSQQAASIFNDGPPLGQARRRRSCLGLSNMVGLPGARDDANDMQSVVSQQPSVLEQPVGWNQGDYQMALDGLRSEMARHKREWAQTLHSMQDQMQNYREEKELIQNLAEEYQKEKLVLNQKVKKLEKIISKQCCDACKPLFADQPVNAPPTQDAHQGGGGGRMRSRMSFVWGGGGGEPRSTSVNTHATPVGDSNSNRSLSAVSKPPSSPPAPEPKRLGTIESALDFQVEPTTGRNRSSLAAAALFDLPPPRMGGVLELRSLDSNRLLTISPPQIELNSPKPARPAPSAIGNALLSAEEMAELLELDDAMSQAESEDVDSEPINPMIAPSSAINAQVIDDIRAPSMMKFDSDSSVDSLQDSLITSSGQGFPLLVQRRKTFSLPPPSDDNRKPQSQEEHAKAQIQTQKAHNDEDDAVISNLLSQIEVDMEQHQSLKQAEEATRRAAEAFFNNPHNEAPLPALKLSLNEQYGEEEYQLRAVGIRYKAKNQTWIPESDDTDTEEHIASSCDITNPSTPIGNEQNTKDGGPNKQQRFPPLPLLSPFFQRRPPYGSTRD